jgi:hypothetical protein
LLAVALFDFFGEYVLDRFAEPCCDFRVWQTHRGEVGGDGCVEVFGSPADDGVIGAGIVVGAAVVEVFAETAAA